MRTSRAVASPSPLPIPNPIPSGRYVITPCNTRWGRAGRSLVKKARSPMVSAVAPLPLGYLY